MAPSEDPAIGPYPGGARFAFTILDDTDDGTQENLGPIYELLESLGMRTTKTVWLFRHDAPSHFHACETLEDPTYLAWVLELQSKGFEITWHGASFESSTRERTRAALDRFEELFGKPPRVHANHALNRENLYWGRHRFDLPLLGSLFSLASGQPRDHFQGHIEGSPWWWGDLCQGRVTYARNLTFSRLNLATINPSMPYRDPNRPLVPLWFSASDAPSVREFAELTSPESVRRLEAEEGFTVVATHLGKGFVRSGRVDTTVRRNLEYLAGRGGWFPTTGELLDWLSNRSERKALPRSERVRMEARFALHLVRNRMRNRLAAHRRD